MLEYLLKSQTRKAVLVQLYQDVENKGIHLRALARNTQEHVYSIQREIQNLKKLGIITTFNQFNKIMVKLDPTHPYYFDLQRMVCKDTGLGYMVIKNRKKLTGLDYAVLTHYYLDNNRRGKFDIDLLLVGAPNLELTNSLIQTAEQQLDRDIMYSVMKSEEFAFRKNQQDAFVWNILKNNYVVLLGNESILLA